MANELEIIEILTLLAEIHGSEPPSVTGYVWALEDVDAEMLLAAAREATKTVKWFPKPVELREIAGRLERERTADAGRRDYLMIELIDLEDRFYRTRDYDPSRMEQIGGLYERAGHEHKAGWVREKSRRWAAILAAETSAARPEAA